MNKKIKTLTYLLLTSMVLTMICICLYSFDFSSSITDASEIENEIPFSYSEKLPSSNIEADADIDSKDLVVIYDSSKITTSTTKTITKKVNTTVTTKTVSITKKDGKVDSKYINNVNSQLKKVPANVMNSFNKNGWNLYVTDKNLASTFFSNIYSSVRGVTIYRMKTIYIEDRAIAVKTAPLHELGHYVDYANGMPSYNKEFKSIYKEEVNTFKSRIPNSGSVRDEQEFFASTFYYIFNDPSKCTPKAKDYVQNYISRL